MIRILLAACFLLGSVSASCFSQEVDPPQDQGRYYMTLFTHAEWQSIPEEARLVSMLEEGDLKKLKDACFFRHYTTEEPVYATGRYWSVPEAAFPALIISDSRGAYFYKIQKGNIPATSAELLDSASTAYKRDKQLHSEELASPPLPANEIDHTIAKDDELVGEQFDAPEYMSMDTDMEAPYFPNARWNSDAAQDAVLEGILGGEGSKPIRSAMGWVMWIVGALIFVIVATMILLSLALVVCMVLLVFK